MQAEEIHLCVEASIWRWNIRFDEVVTGFGFIKSEEDSCLYKKLSGRSIMFLILYVDGILLIGNDVSMLNSVKGSLNGKVFDERPW